jgi:flagellar basal-body rod protein FlgB
MMDVVNLIEKALNVRSLYHKVLSGNIANVETPNYKEKDIDFETEIQKQMAGTSSIQVKEKTEDDGMNSIDGNTVNIEKQMVKMTENSMVYSSLVQIINKKFSMLKYAITEGRG